MNMRKVKTGLVLGALAGIIDVIPMVMQNLTWDANLAAFSMWVVIGFFLATVNIKIKGALKGILVSFLVLLPSAILIGWQEPLSLIPVFIMTLLLGSALSLAVDKFTKSTV